MCMKKKTLLKDEKLEILLKKNIIIYIIIDEYSSESN